jgi:hypothetical protein
MLILQKLSDHLRHWEGGQYHFLKSDNTLAQRETEAEHKSGICFNSERVSDGENCHQGMN